MKWLVFAAAVVASGVLGRWLRGRPRAQSRVWALVGFLPFFYTIDVAIVSDRVRPGDAHGLEIALIDLLAFALLLALPRARPRLPYAGVVTAYFVAALASLLQAESPGHGFFYLWTLGRMFFLCAVLRAAGEAGDAPMGVLRGMTLGTFFQLAVALWQRYGLGVHQVPGTFAHQNSLGMALNLAAMAPLALVLARKAGWRMALAPLAALAAIVLTLSRGALLFFALGGLLLFLLSFARRPTSRKLRMAALGLAAAAALLAKGADTIGRRFSGAPPEALELRWRFEDAASRMLRDRPLGVGANHFTWMMVHRGYGDRAGIDAANKTAIVHNVYWLTAAEMGYPGLLALLALFAAPLLHALRQAFRLRRDARGDVLLGLGVSLLICYAHGTVEFAWRSTEISYLFWMIVAMVPALARQAERAAAASAGRLAAA